MSLSSSSFDELGDVAANAAPLLMTSPECVPTSPVRVVCSRRSVEEAECSAKHRHSLSDVDGYSSGSSLQERERVGTWEFIDERSSESIGEVSCDFLTTAALAVA